MLNVLFAAAALGLFAAAARVWIVTIRRWSRGVPLVHCEPHRFVPWGLLDVLLAIALLFTFSIFANIAVNQRFDVTAATPPAELPVSYYRWKVSGQAFASLAALIATAGMIWWRRHVSPSALVSQTAHVWRDVRLGAAAFWALAPPTYALQYLLVQWADSKHPIVELLRNHPDPGLILASVGSAVIVAPLFEEFLFRGLLQGWLEKLVSFTGPPGQLFLGTADQERERSAIDPGADTVARDQQRDPRLRCRDNPYAAPVVPIDHSQLSHSLRDEPMPAGLAGYLPIIASSMLFAALHVSHGPDWIPLFFLSLGLGYLYRQTHRLLPCITVHFLLNGCSMGMFLIELLRS